MFCPIFIGPVSDPFFGPIFMGPIAGPIYPVWAGPIYPVWGSRFQLATPSPLTSSLLDAEICEEKVAEQ